MNRAWAWVVVVIAIVAVWVDIPKHQFQFPFDGNCPGICYRLGGQSTFIEIKTHLGLDLQGGTQLVLQLRPDLLPGPTTTSIDDLNAQAKVVIDRRINSLGVSEPVIESLGADKILLQLPGVSDLQQAKDIAQWDSLVAQYDARRSPFLDNHVQDLAPVGNTLYWYNTTNFQFALRRYDDTTGAKVSYGFAVGDSNTAFYRASSTVVVTVDGGMDPVVYHAWDASQPK